MGKRITAGIIAALMLFMVAAPGSAVRADGADNVTRGDAAGIGSEGVSDEETYIDEELSENLRRAALYAGVDKNEDGKISVAEAEECKSLTIKKADGEDDTITGIERFCNLQKLEVSGGFSQLPDLGNLANLWELNVQCNQLAELSGLENLVNLKHLYANSNQLTKLPGLEKLTNLSELNVSDNQLEELPGLGNLTKLRKLIVSNNQLQELSGLENLTDLIWLYADENQLKVLPDLENFTKLETLLVGENQLTELQGLENLSNLRSLNVSNATFGSGGSNNNRFAKLPGLEKLTKLRHLDAEKIQLTELPNLGNLPNLTELKVGFNQLTELPGLENLVNMEHLEASCNRLTELPGLENMTKLSWLEIHDNWVTDLSGLSNLTELRYLMAANNKLTELPYLKECKNLVGGMYTNYVAFYGNQITETEARAKLPQHLLDNTEWFEKQDFLKKENTYIESKLSENLRRAAIAAGVDVNKDGKISAAEAETCTELKIAKEDGEDDSIIGLEYFCNLQSLTIQGGFQVLPSLRELPNLQRLDVSYNALTELPGLENLNNLTYLCAMENQLTELPELDGLSNLAVLDVSGNKLAALQADKLPKNLEEFDVGANQLTEVLGLGGLNKLTKLDVSKNQLTEVPELGGLSKLTYLNVSQNQLTELIGLEDLNNLSCLYAGYNQLTKLPDLKKSYNLVSDVHSPDNPELNPYPWSDFSGNQIYESEACAKLPQQLLDDTEWFERQGFLKDEVPEPEPEPDPRPGDKYEIDLGDGETGIGSDAFEELLKKNKHCTVEINLNNGVQFSFEMGSMHVVEGKDVYDFGCTLIRNYEKLPPAMQNVIRSNSFVTRILYNYSGKLPGTVSIRIYVGQQYAGQTLYYYRENKDNTFTFMQEALVDADGYITVQQDHCSDYILLGEKREDDNMSSEPGTDTPSGTTPDEPSETTPNTPTGVTPGIPSDSASDVASGTLLGTANPLPVTQEAPTLAGSTTAPKTGDDNAVTVHMMLLLFGMTGILTAGIGIAGRRRKVLPGRKR